MIIPLTGLLIGALFGAFRANARGGNRLDMLQWAAAFGIFFFLIGMFILVFLERAAV